MIDNTCNSPLLNENEAALALLGTTEDLIALGTILARRSWPLTAVYGACQPRTLESTLLLGCPAVATPEQAVQKAKLALIVARDSELSQLCQVAGQAGLVTVVVHTTRSDWPLQKFSNLSIELTDQTILYLLEVPEELPEIGRDIYRHDGILRPFADTHPQGDYQLDGCCSGLKLYKKTAGSLQAVALEELPDLLSKLYSTLTNMHSN